MKHKNLLQAWLNGDTIQIKIGTADNWNDLASCDECNQSYNFHDVSNYRIKPKTKVVYVHTYQDGFHNTRFNDVQSAKVPSTNLKLTFEENILVNAELAGTL